MMYTQNTTIHLPVVLIADLSIDNVKSPDSNINKE